VGEFHDMAAEGGRMRGYFALPERANGCGIVLGSSIWGINSDLRAVADGYASLGYAVVAPNLFWRRTDVEGTEYDPAKFDVVVKFVEAQSDEQSADDMRRAKQELVRRAGTRRHASIGWCYGGRIACRDAATTTYELCVGIYPTLIDKHLDLAARLARPVMVHLAENEKYTSIPDSIGRTAAAFNGPLARSHVYPGAAHGFDFAPPHPSSNHLAARLCDQRVMLALDRVLARGESL
jgi:carboxymethylenebutenolidase